MPLVQSEAAAQVVFIGAGPGDPDLLTVKAQRLIAQADVIIYADSLIAPEVCAGARQDAMIYGSSTLTLEETTALMMEAVAHGQRVARLQSGDPSIYGALHEQMALLDQQDISYLIVPGVSSAFAAAALLGIELTVPEVAQTVIFTRHAGRVAVPEGESLRSLASHGATICIFLSITRVHQVVKDLLAGGYAPDTPVAIVYRATWPDQQIIHSTIARLVEDVRQMRVARQALIVVGWALAPQSGQEDGATRRSHLYQPTYTHLFRRGQQDETNEAAEASERIGEGDD